MSDQPQPWRLSELIPLEVERNGDDPRNWSQNTQLLLADVESKCDGPEWRYCKSQGWDKLVLWCEAMGR